MIANIHALQSELQNNPNFYKTIKRLIATNIQQECQRFRIIKGNDNLTTQELDTIAWNAADNMLKEVLVNEIIVKF